MIEMNLDFSGLEQLAKDLETLSKSQSKKVLRNATRAGAEVIAEAVRETAPIRTGKLSRNVVVVTQKGRQRDELSSGVHITGVNPETGNSDNSMKASNPKNAFYWRFVELGTVSMPAIPFLRPAYDKNLERAAEAAMQRANEAVDEVLSQ